MDRNSDSPEITQELFLRRSLDSINIPTNMSISSRRIPPHADTSASVITNGSLVVPDEPVLPYDPNEPVPSYESSQLMHRHSPNVSRHSSVTEAQGGATTNTANIFNTEAFFRTSSEAFNNASARVPHAKKSLKQFGLKFLNARQHFALACCRDLSLIPCLYGLFQSWSRVFVGDNNATSHIIRGQVIESFTVARTSEHFLTGVWCIVAGYLSYSVLDGLMVRWIVTYLTSAAIVRMLSMSTIIVTVEQYLVATFSANGYRYGLHIWILISCCLTICFIIQNFVTLNLDLKDGRQRARFFDFYKIAVFAVVPVGLASFITMIGLLRSLLILRLDIDHNLL